MTRNLGRLLRFFEILCSRNMCTIAVFSSSTRIFLFMFSFYILHLLIYLTKSCILSFVTVILWLLGDFTMVGWRKIYKIISNCYPYFEENKKHVCIKLSYNFAVLCCLSLKEPVLSLWFLKLMKNSEQISKKLAILLYLKDSFLS